MSRQLGRSWRSASIIATTVADRVLEPRRQRRLVAEVPRQMNNSDASIPGGDLRRAARRAGARAVVHSTSSNSKSAAAAQARRDEVLDELLLVVDRATTLSRVVREVVCFDIRVVTTRVIELPRGSR